MSPYSRLTTGPDCVHLRSFPQGASPTVSRLWTFHEVLRGDDRRYIRAQRSCWLTRVGFRAPASFAGSDFSNYHGISGKFDPASKRALRNEIIAFKGGGILPALSSLLEEEEEKDQHSLTEILSQLPFIHRAYRYTFRSHPELFIPVQNVVYRKDDHDYVWITARIEGRFADGRSLSTLPAEFEVDAGYVNECVIRTKGTPKNN